MRGNYRGNVSPSFWQARKGLIITNADTSNQTLKAVVRQFPDQSENYWQVQSHVRILQEGQIQISAYNWPVRFQNPTEVLPENYVWWGQARARTQETPAQAIPPRRLQPLPDQQVEEFVSLVRRLLPSESPTFVVSRKFLWQVVPTEFQVRQVRLWPIPVELPYVPPVIDDPATRQSSQRFDLLPEYDFQWWQQNKNRYTKIISIPAEKIVWVGKTNIVISWTGNTNIKIGW
jgi:hypothetical protein